MNFHVAPGTPWQAAARAVVKPTFSLVSPIARRLEGAKPRWKPLQTTCPAPNDAISHSDGPQDGPLMCRGTAEPAGIRPPAICRLRLAPVSGISAPTELWPSG